MDGGLHIEQFLRASDRRVDHDQAGHNHKAQKRYFKQAVQTVTHLVTLQISVPGKRGKLHLVPRR